MSAGRSASVIVALLGKQYCNSFTESVFQEQNTIPHYSHINTPSGSTHCTPAQQNAVSLVRIKRL